MTFKTKLQNSIKNQPSLKGQDGIILVYTLPMRRKLFHKNLDHIRVFELCKKREILSKIANERNFNV